jgi:5,5'-dehydrodivanillate O-demethylase oxygenase subunit
MLSQEQNDRITRVGPGTPMGELMRRYWQPFLPADKLLENPVQPVRLLGEDLVCYKDRSGTIGLIANRCAHRLVGLQFGIPQEHGIRCMYHGWCYDETGACTDTPFEPEQSKLKEMVHLANYPVQELGGLLFAYMGPAPAPLLPTWELFVVPNALRQIGHTVLPCNWLQCQENASDPTHTVYTHGFFGQYVGEERGGVNMGYANFMRPEAYEGFSHVIQEMDEYGLQKACVYKKELGAPEDEVDWHSTTIFPHNVRVGSPNSASQHYQIRVPIDDEHTWHIAYHVYMAPPEVEVEPQEVVPSFEIPLKDEYGRDIFDYVLSQDYVAWWSQGALTDRSLEMLGVTDTAIVAFRNLLDQQAAIVEAGGEPMNVFRDPAEMPDAIKSKPYLGEWDRIAGKVQMPKFGGQGDRYGPIIKEVEELWDRIRDHYAKEGAPA